MSSSDANWLSAECGASPRLTGSGSASSATRSTAPTLGATRVVITPDPVFRGVPLDPGIEGAC
eukprot:1413102-Heterocapsa_arctica.AAC.1